MAVIKLSQYVKPADLVFDANSGLWTKTANILGNTYAFADSDPLRVCELVDRHIRFHVGAHNRGPVKDEELVEFHASDILPLTTSFLAKLRQA